MPQELSLEEFGALSEGAAQPSTGAAPGRFISASLQGSRDQDALDTLKGERTKEDDPSNREALDREIKARRKTAAPRTMSLEDFGNIAQKAPTSPPPPPAKPTPAQTVRTFKDQAVQAGHEVAAVGDMILSLPAMAAGALGEIGMRVDLASQGVTHKAAAEGAAEFRNHIIEGGSPTWFADAMAAMAPADAKKPDPTLVAKVSNWLSDQIAAGGKFMDKKTGGVITDEDVSMAANAAMAALGVKGMGKIGPKIPKVTVEVEKPLAKTPVEGTEGLVPEAGPQAKTLEPPKSPREAIERPIKTARKARAFTDEEVESMHQKWVAYTSQLANQEASKVAAKENEAKPTLDPTVSEKGMKPIEGETPVTPSKEGEPPAEPVLNKQAGGVSTKLLGTMAGVGLGMAAGAYLDEDNPIIGAALGAILVPKPLGAIMEGVGKLGKGILGGDDRLRINDITEQHDLNVQRAARTVAQVQSKLAELVPKRKDREAIHNAIDQGTVGSLTGKQAEAARIAQDFYAQVEKDAKAAGTLDEGRANYSTHIWREADKDTLQSIIDQKAGPSMSPNSKFNKERAFVTMQEGKAAGLKPLTEDIGEIVGLYGNSMYRSIANAKLLSRLKQAQTFDGTPLVQSATKAPANYQSINHPTLQGLRVHPDIMPSLKFMFEAQEPHAIMAGLTALNTAIKRNAVSFSLFHAKALSDAMLGAVNNPLQVGKVIAQASLPKIFGTNRYLKMLKEGGAGDLVDKAFRDGLKVSFERSESVDADVGGGFYKGMQVLQDAADKVLPFGVGKAAVKTYVRINHAFDNFMWGRLHAGMKLEVYAAKKEALLVNNAKAGHAISEQEAGKMAATYANDIFGGLHWQRLAEGSRTKWGRDLALAMNSPRGRMATQLLMFAPDWTLSTARAFYKAMPFFNKGSGISGVFSAKTATDLYRQQLVRSALYYAAVGDAINVSMSGHHLWENKDGDWTMVELGDGRRMQLSKHFMEPFHWLRQPGQQALNKLGVIPKEAANQALGTEYLSSKGRMPPMKEGRLGHLAKNFVPIAGNQFGEGGVEAGVAGFMGFPIYGKTEEQRRQEAKDRRNKRFQEQLKQYRKLHGLDDK